MAPGRWVKIWVPQPMIAAGGNCSLFKWVREDRLKALEEKEMEPEKLESNTEVLFLCSYQGCGKTFIDAMALRKHAHVHGERQYVCQYEGCGKKFMDSSKLKRHFLIHTGERDFVCNYEGCGKAFSLDFNLRSHMRTHYPENYHVCSYPKCGKRFTHESKLLKHIKAQHEKAAMIKHTPQANKHHNAPKALAAPPRAASVDRPYGCPYEGCGKAYIHEYKLNLHLKREHPGNDVEENDSAHNSLKRSKLSATHKMPPPKIPNRMVSSLPRPNVAVQNQWQAKDTYEDDSEETDEDDENDSSDEETESSTEVYCVRKLEESSQIQKTLGT